MPGRSTRAWVVYVVLLIALLIGVVSAVLVGGTGGTTGNSGGHVGEVIIDLPLQVWGLIFLSPLLVGWAVVLLRRLLGDGMSMGGRNLAVIGAIFALALLFIYVLSTLGGGGGGTISVVGPTHVGVNNSTGTGTGAGGGGSNGTGSGTPYSGPSLQLPSWAVFVFVGVLCTLVALVAVPGVISAVVDRRPKHLSAAGEAEQAREQFKQALAEATAALQAGADPRTTIVRLYQRLLAELGPKVNDLDKLTAEEIRTLSLAQLKVRPDAAEALTRLFEEARYSTHPMGPAAAERCRAALQVVEADLAQGPKVLGS